MILVFGTGKLVDQLGPEPLLRLQFVEVLRIVGAEWLCLVHVSLLNPEMLL